jgi:hypothetical protein
MTQLCRASLKKMKEAQLAILLKSFTLLGKRYNLKLRTGSKESQTTTTTFRLRVRQSKRLRSFGLKIKIKNSWTRGDRKNSSIPSKNGLMLDLGLRAKFRGKKNTPA